MPNSRTSDPRALTAGLIAIACYGITPVMIRIFVDHLDPWTVNGVRYAIGCLFWLPFVLLSPREAFGRGKDSVWRDALLPSAINAAGQIGWGVSPYLINAPMMAFVYRLSFLCTIALGLIYIRDERPLVRERAFHAGTALCIAGLGLMFWERFHGGVGGSLLALGVVLGTNVMFGGYAVSVKRCMLRHDVRLSFGVISLYTTGLLVVLMPVLGQPQRLADLDAGLWALLVVSALVGIAIAHVLYYRAIRGLGAIVSTGLLMGSPFVTAVAAQVFINEKMTALQVVGGLGLVAGGLLLLKAWSRVEARRQSGAMADDLAP